MSKSTIFITGATGFIGAQVTLSALRAGYNVKLSVRREAQIASLQAFDTALQGVDFVIHVASPLPNGNEDLLTPAVKGTTSVLEAALKVPSIKKVVITASVASLVPLDKYVDGTVVTEDISAEELHFDDSIVPSLDPGRQYRASKIASYLATLNFISSHHPHFSVVTLHPVYVFGHNLLQKHADEVSGTNKMLFNSFISDAPLFAPYRGVHVDDVAEAHIRALSLPSTPISSYLLSAKARAWEEVLEFVKHKYPEQGFKTKPEEGDLLIVKTEKAENELGFKEWKEMEVQVSDVIEQQIELRRVSSI
ncbi:NAD dependent epimerase/dehydratase family protein [Aureobasidium sp. EXF-3400]|nr:NAD dependent epimerase/dehydratase family protein [Aureobasidium sp. EXF-12344]KAI4775980.1 NAD dependent epimerase/dehydratase family protein [Aureobasidium sp. EXF-3400]